MNISLNLLSYNWSLVPKRGLSEHLWFNIGFWSTEPRLFVFVHRNAELFFAKLKHSLSVHKKLGDTEAVTLLHNFVYNLHLDTQSSNSVSLCELKYSLAPVNDTIICVRQARVSTASTLVYVCIHV